MYVYGSLFFPGWAETSYFNLCNSLILGFQNKPLSYKHIKSVIEFLLIMMLKTNIVQLLVFLISRWSLCAEQVHCDVEPVWLAGLGAPSPYPSIWCCGMSFVAVSLGISIALSQWQRFPHLEGFKYIYGKKQVNSDSVYLRFVIISVGFCWSLLFQCEGKFCWSIE